MKLADFLAPSRVLVPLACETLDGARVALLARLAASGAIADLERLQLRVAEERGEDMVAIADHAFLLHYRTDTASALQVALGVCPRESAASLDDGAEQRAPVVVDGRGSAAARRRDSFRWCARLGGCCREKRRSPRSLDAPSAESIVTLPMFAEYEIPEQLLVRDLMTERPRTTTPDTPLRKAARELIRYGTRRPSGRGSRPALSRDVERAGVDATPARDRGVVRWNVAPRAASAPTTSKTVRDVMTRQVLCVAPEQPAAEVAALMSNKDVERVPVVREGKLVGFLTRGDIVRKLIGP